MTQEAQQAAAPAADNSRTTLWAGVAFVAVLLGMLLALCAHDLVEDWQDRRLETRYLERLRMDLAADLDELETTELRAEAYRESAGVVLGVIHGTTDPSEHPELALHVLRAGQVHFPTLTQSTIGELHSTGHLSLVRSHIVKQQIARYYDSHQQRLQWEAMLRARQVDYTADVVGLLPAELIGRIDWSNERIEGDGLPVLIAERLRDRAGLVEQRLVPMLLVNSRMGEFVRQYGHQARVLTHLIEDELAAD